MRKGYVCPAYVCVFIYMYEYIHIHIYIYMYTYTDFFLQSKDSDIGSIAVWTWRGRAALAPAVCYSMLRCVAVGVLLYVAFCCRCGLERSSDTSASSVLHYIAVCYSQRVVVCCSTLQFAAESANWRGHIYIYVHIYIS